MGNIFYIKSKSGKHFLLHRQPGRVAVFNQSKRKFKTALSAYPRAWGKIEFSYSPWGNCSKALMHITICLHHKMCVYMSAKLSQIYMDLLTPIKSTYKTEKLKPTDANTYWFWPAALLVPKLPCTLLASSGLIC